MRTTAKTLVAFCLVWSTACGSEEVQVLESRLVRAEEVEGQWKQEELEEVAREIQAEVADMRGLAFERPVAVELSGKAEFLAHARERMDEFTPEGKLASDQDIARHLGMIPPDMDLLAVTMDLLADQVGGFYSPASETFYLMRTFTGAAAKVILAHELCHALDDQHFDLDAGFERTMVNSDAATAYAAVVEGSGTALMERYTIRHMGEFSMDELMEASSASSAGLGEAPPYIWKPLLAVYLRGKTFLHEGYQRDRRALKAQRRKGDDRPKADPNLSVNEAFASPPRSSEQVLHPEKYWDPEGEGDEPRSVEHDTARLPEGWEEAQRDVLGELLLAIFTTPFDGREGPDMSDPAAALTLEFTNGAATGWDGDEVLLLRRGEARIVDLATVWDSSDDAVEFERAVEALREGLEERLAELGAGSGGESGLSVTREEDRVRVVAWSGAGRADVEAVVAAVGVTVD